MFKSVSLFVVALLSVAAAAPQVVSTLPLVRSAIVAEPTHVQVHEPALAKVGDVVESVPTAVSHRSSTIVHSKAHRVTPIVAPAVRSYAAPAVRTYAAPIVEHATPLVGHAAAPVFRSSLGPAAAFVHAHAAGPLQLRAFPATYAAYGYSGAYGAPLVYAAAPVATPVVGTPVLK